MSRHSEIIPPAAERRQSSPQPYASPGLAIQSASIDFSLVDTTLSPVGSTRALLWPALNLDDDAPYTHQRKRTVICPGWLVLLVLLVIGEAVVWFSGALPMLVTVDQGLTDVAAALTSTRAQRLVSEIETFFRRPQRLLTQIDAAITSGELQYYNQSSVVNWFGPYAADGNANFFYLNNGIGWIIAARLDTSTITFTPPSGRLVVFAMNASSNVLPIALYSLTSVPTQILQVSYNFTYDFRTSTVYQSFANFSSWSRGWTSPSIVFTQRQLGMMAGLPIYESRTNRTIIGEVLCLVLVKNITYLTQNIAGYFGETVAVFDGKTGLFFGGNFPDGGLRNVTNASGATTGEQRVAELCEADSPAVKDLCRAIPKAVLQTCKSPCSLSYEKPGRRSLLLSSARIAVRVQAITDPYGLDIRVVSILGEREVAAKSRAGVLRALAISIPIIAFLMVSGAVVVRLAFTPLDTVLEVNLIDAAALAPEDSWDVHTPFAEIAAVLRAFQKLWVELRIVHTFMPQGISSLQNSRYGSSNSLLFLLPTDPGGSASVVGEGANDTFDGIGLSYPQAADAETATMPAGDTLSNTVPNLSALPSAMMKAATTSSASRNSISRSNITFAVPSSHLQKRFATVLYVNLSNTHCVVRSEPAPVFSDWMSGMVEFVVSTVRRHNGVLESFFGDRFLLSFNASRRCSAHAKCAVSFLLALDEGFRHLVEENRHAPRNSLVNAADPQTASHAPAPHPAPFPAHGVATDVHYFASVGGACGLVVFGTMGNRVMSRSAVLGHAVGNAFFLASICKANPHCTMLLQVDVLKSANVPIPGTHTEAVKERSGTAVSILSPPAAERPPSSSSNEIAAAVGLHVEYLVLPSSTIAATADHATSIATFATTLLRVRRNASSSSSPKARVGSEVVEDGVCDPLCIVMSCGPPSSQQNSLSGQPRSTASDSGFTKREDPDSGAAASPRPWPMSLREVALVNSCFAAYGAGNAQRSLELAQGCPVALVHRLLRHLPAPGVAAASQ